MTNLEAAVILTWQGQACFSLVSPGGTRVLIDPIPDDIGYRPKKIDADIATVSHEHFDHANTALALGQPKILHGLTTDLKNWQKHDQKIGDVRIRNVGVHHDQSQGKERGSNSVFIFETAGISLA